MHLVMRLPAPGTARRKRDPTTATKDAAATSAGGASARGAQGAKVKAEPTQDEDVAAMSFAGMRQISDMLVDGDAMEFDQVTDGNRCLWARACRCVEQRQLHARGVAAPARC